jgi:hypothetical protein
MRHKIAVMALLLAIPALAGAQQEGKKDDDVQGMPGMQGMQMPGMNMGGNDLMNMHPETFLQGIVRHTGSGTSAEPDSVPIPMLMTTKGKWTLMLHANAFVLDEQQTGPRGSDKFFSTNWAMGMAQRAAGPGVFTARAMLSLEPATITGRQYPLLFQQGETAFGKPIVDGQHPHNFFMEIAALYDLKLGKNGLLSFYAAPIGDPAIGPLAYAHRASAAEDPLAPLGHHQEDSTHISEDVVTLGLAYRIVRVEASGFHGREPDENRWNISQGKIDSWSTRVTLQPRKNWSGQYSYARITSPEALFPNEDQERMTAAVMYNRPIHRGAWASSLIWGRTKSPEDGSVFNSYGFESTLGFLTSNHVWARIEDAERSNELLLGENPIPPNFVEQAIGRVQAYTFGYDRDFNFVPHFSSALGAQVTLYSAPAILQPAYGAHPVGVTVFIRLRPISGEHQ